MKKPPKGGFFFTTIKIIVNKILLTTILKVSFLVADIPDNNKTSDYIHSS